MSDSGRRSTSLNSRRMPVVSMDSIFKLIGVFFERLFQSQSPVHSACGEPEKSHTPAFTVPGSLYLTWWEGSRAGIHMAEGVSSDVGQCDNRRSSQSTRVMLVGWLGRVPLDPRTELAGDYGESFFEAYSDSPACRELEGVVRILRRAMGLPEEK